MGKRLDFGSRAQDAISEKQKLEARIKAINKKVNETRQRVS